MLDDVHGGASVTGELHCSDPSDTGLNFVAEDPPGHGQAFADGAGFVTYYPDADYAGPDGFDVTVSDNEGGTATVAVTVEVVNAAPTCANVALSTGRNQAAFGSADCDDADFDSLTYTVGTPAHGQAEASSSAASPTRPTTTSRAPTASPTAPTTRSRSPPRPR